MDQANSVNAEQNIGDAVGELKTEQGFTPGPWKIETPRDREEAGGWDETYPRGVAVRADWSAPVNGLLGYEICCMSGVNDHTLPDARLIAAAPALYEALKESALAVHTIGAYHHPSWIVFEQCDKPLCVQARKVLALVDHARYESAKRPISALENDGPASKTTKS